MSRIRRIAGVIVRSIVVLVLLCLTILQVRTCTPAPRPEDRRIAEVRAQLAHLRRALRDEDAAARMQDVFPEGACFLATLYALSWANLAAAAGDEPTRASAAGEMTYALGVIDSPVATRPFDDTQVRFGVIWSGQRNLVLGELLSLQPPELRDAALVAQFRDASREISDAFLAAPTRHLETFRGLTWPADQTAALASLAVHDRLLGGDLARAVRAWRDWTLAHLDASTGLPPAQIDAKTGASMEAPRGCGNSWILAFLPRADAALSREFYARCAEHHGLSRLGFRMFAEWPGGESGHADVDSGPIVWGVGTAATGIGLAAARANGDAERAADIYALAQGFGFPWTSDGGAAKSYLFGQVPLADAFLAFGLSTNLPPAAEEDARGRMDLLLSRWKFHALVTSIQLVIAASIVRDVLRSRRRRDAAGPASSPARPLP